MVKAQAWLDRYYPLEKTNIRNREDYAKTRSEIIHLDIREQNLEGELDLADFFNLEELKCWRNQLTQIILPPNNRIRVIFASNNLLTTFTYDRLNSQTLTHLRLRNNNLEATSLSVFSHLANLEFLDLRNTLIRGDLIALKNLTKLSYLDISDTDINAGVEYLPNSLEILGFDTDLRPDCQLTTIVDKLKIFEALKKEDVREKWKSIGQQSIKDNQARVESLQQEINRLEERINKVQQQTQIEVLPSTYN